LRAAPHARAIRVERDRRLDPPERRGVGRLVAASATSPNSAARLPARGRAEHGAASATAADPRQDRPGPAAVPGSPRVFKRRRDAAAAPHCSGSVALALADRRPTPRRSGGSSRPVTLDAYRASIGSRPQRLPSAPPRDVLRLFAVDGPGNWWSATQFVVHDARLTSGYAGIIPARSWIFESGSLRVAGVAALVVGETFARLDGALPRARLCGERPAQRGSEARRSTRSTSETTALVEDPVEVRDRAGWTAAIERDDPAGSDRDARCDAQLLVLAES